MLKTHGTERKLLEREKIELWGELISADMCQDDD